MILIHIEDFDHADASKKARKPTGEATKISCKNGWEMASTVSKISNFCTKSNNESMIVWDTEHHTVLLWFEDEKIRTLFSLKGLIKGA